MNKKITFRSMDHSPVMEKHINEQLAKIISFLEHEREPIHIEIVVEAGRPHAHHTAELLIKSPHYDCMTKCEGPQVYRIIDRIIDAMYLKLRDRKKEILEEQRSKDRFKGS